MLSPTRTVTMRRGSGRRRRKAVAAATSGGETTAPSANAEAHGSPRTTRCATQATAAMVNSTCPTPSDKMGRRLARTSRYDARSDARYRSGGVENKEDNCGADVAAGRPGARAGDTPAVPEHR